jgi:hypothetical protein
MQLKSEVERVMKQKNVTPVNAVKKYGERRMRTGKRSDSEKL